MIKVELQKAFFSKYFVVTCLLNLIMLMIGGCDYICEYVTGYISPGTFLEKFLMSYGCGMTCLMAVLFPITAIIPHVLSYRRERDSGYLRLVVLKTTARNYRQAKIMAVTSSGFMAFFLPCLIWLLVCYFLLGTGETGDPIIYGVDFAKRLYASKPFLYGMVYSLNAGLQGAVFALLGLGLSAVIPNYYLAAVLPFCYCIFSASILVMYNRALNALSLFVIDQYQNALMGYGGILVYDLLLILIGCGLFIGGDLYAGKG